MTDNDKTTRASEPECPACGYRMRDAYLDFDPYKEDEELDTECRCGAQLLITRSVSVTYITRLAAK